MSKNKETLQELQKQWYKTLEDSGFSDLEYFDANMKPKEWMKGNHRFTNLPVDDASHLQDDTDTLSVGDTYTYNYFVNASRYLEYGEFTSDYEKDIWSLHAEGLSSRDIGKQVGKSHPAVLRVIGKIKNDMLEWIRCNDIT